MSQRRSRSCARFPFPAVIVNKEHIAHLKKQDPVLRAIIGRINLPEQKPRPDRFRALVRAIIGQQLSGKAARAIMKRFEALFAGKKFPGPKDILAMPSSKMRNAGLSNMKASYLKDLSRKTLDGSVNLKTIHALGDEDIIAHLVQVKGIGRWTAEMFLMFSLNREDVFSYGDLGLRNAMKAAYKLRAHPSRRTAEKIASKWKPYRTLASRYLWASLEK